MTVRVVTLNLWNVEGPWTQRMAVVRKGLLAMGADLVGLQEVVSPELGGADQLSTITPEGFFSAWCNAPAAGWPIGNALISRWPITWFDREELPRCGTNEIRSVLHATVDAPFGEVHVMVTHLNWKLAQGNVRVQQVKFLTELINTVDFGPFPLILMGDFNAEPDSDEMRYLKGHTAVAGRTTFFVDCVHTATGENSPTFCRRNPYAAKSWEPDRRLDYIWMKRKEATSLGFPSRGGLCFDEPVEGIWASDHFGVWVDLLTE